MSQLARPACLRLTPAHRPFVADPAWSAQEGEVPKELRRMWGGWNDPGAGAAANDMFTQEMVAAQVLAEIEAEKYLRAALRPASAARLG